MYFSRSFFVTLLAAPYMALAQNPNPFNIPSAGLSATAGQPLALSWQATTSGTVSLILRSGASSSLNAGTTIASSIPNSGSYTWTPPTSITRGSDYTIEIVDDADTTQTNYTPYFVIESTNTVASSTPAVTLGAPTSSLTLSTASRTGTSSASATSGSSTLTTSVSSTASSSTTGTASSSEGTSSHSSSTSHSSSAASTFVASTSSGAGSRATAMVGMLGAVALGALAI